MTVGERIKAVRAKTGMSQVDFATKINVSKQTLYKYENDIITNIPFDKIESIANLGRVSPAYLMGWKDKENLSFANRFNSIRKEKNISFEYIARHTNFSLPYIQKIAAGAADTESEDMAKIASALDVSYFYLMGWEDEETMLIKKATDKAYLYDETINNLKQFGNDYYKLFQLYHSMNQLGKRKALDILNDLAFIYTTEKTDISDH